jgi:hypothetical protein
MLLKRIKVGPHNRALVIRNGEVHAVLEPGNHVVFVPPLVRMQVETHRPLKLVFKSRWADQLLRNRPDIADKYFHVIETGHTQVALISIDGKLYQVLAPGRRALFWKGVADVKTELVDVIEGPEISDTMLDAFDRKQPYRATDDQFESDDSSSTNLFDALLDEDDCSSSSGATKT